LEYPYLLYVMFHKPLGYICTTEREFPEAKLIYDLLPPTWIKRSPVVKSAGRLDKWASGLLVLSQDGELIHRLTSPKRKGVFGKVYEVKLHHDLSGDEQKIFASGTLKLRSEEKPCRPAKFEVISKEEKLVRISLFEGRYHQLRRMLAACGNRAISIKRVATGPIQLGNLPVGHWREITREELEMLDVEDTRPYLYSERFQSEISFPTFTEVKVPEELEIGVEEEM